MCCYYFNVLINKVQSTAGENQKDFKFFVAQLKLFSGICKVCDGWMEKTVNFQL